MSKKINETKAVVGTVQTFKSKPVAHQVVQFTGKNGKVVADFVREHGGEARNGGNWLKVVLNGGAYSASVKKGDVIIVIPEDQEGIVWTQHGTVEALREHFTVGKNNTLI